MKMKHISNVTIQHDRMLNPTTCAIYKYGKTEFGVAGTTDRFETREQAEDAAINAILGVYAASYLFRHVKVTIRRARPAVKSEPEPRCVCGVDRSEHAGLGCGEWERAR